MALKTEKADAPPVAPPDTTVLELALYKIYTWGNITYEGGKPYRFKNSDAMVLLSERDTDRPVWKIHKPTRTKQAPKNEIVDATSISAPVPVDEFGTPTLGKPLTTPVKKRIDVGTDDEIADILSRPDESGDVTV
jgi:hypothetical protein